MEGDAAEDAVAFCGDATRPSATRRISAVEYAVQGYEIPRPQERYKRSSVSEIDNWQKRWRYVISAPEEG